MSAVAAVPVEKTRKATLSFLAAVEQGSLAAGNWQCHDLGRADLGGQLRANGRVNASHVGQGQRATENRRPAGGCDMTNWLVAKSHGSAARRKFGTRELQRDEAPIDVPQGVDA